MMLVAKRRLTETWRQAVARRAAEDGGGAACLALFDALTEAGETDATAAVRALERYGLLWPVPGPLAAGRPTPDP